MYIVAMPGLVDLSLISEGMRQVPNEELPLTAPKISVLRLSLLPTRPACERFIEFNEDD